MIPLKDDIPSETFPFVNYTLIALNLAVFLFEISLSPVHLTRFIYNFGFVPFKFSYILSCANCSALQAILPVFTSMFIHGGWFHILGNMLFLYIFGDNVEDALGHLKFLIFYLLTGFAAAMFQYLIHPFSKTPMIGASGAIAGVLGAYFILYPHARVFTLIFFLFFVDIIPLPAFVYIFLWFIMQIINGSAALALQGAGGVAWWAHIGGFVAGMGMVLVIKKKPRPRYKYYRPW